MNECLTANDMLEADTVGIATHKKNPLVKKNKGFWHQAQSILRPFSIMNNRVSISLAPAKHRHPGRIRLSHDFNLKSVHEIHFCRQIQFDRKS
jgi:hypothetical protein